MSIDQAECPMALTCWMLVVWASCLRAQLADLSRAAAMRPDWGLLPVAGASAFLGERTLHRNLEVGVSCALGAVGHPSFSHLKRERYLVDVSPGHLPERIEGVAGVGVNGTLHRLKTAHDLLLAPLAVRVVRVEVSAGPRLPCRWAWPCGCDRTPARYG